MKQIRILIKVVFLLILSKAFYSCNSKANTIELYTSEALEVEAMDSFLTNVMDSLKIPALSLVIINDGKQVYHRAIGVMQFGKDNTIDHNSVFESASIAKPVFSYFVLKMAEKGFIDLDRPLHFYLPDDEMAIDKRYKNVTARMVLNHTTGFPNWRWFEKPPKGMTIERGTFFMKSDPGTEFTYSGEGYHYLACVLASNLNVNMAELAEVFRTEVADPLKMTHAYFTWNEHLYENKVRGHIGNNVQPRSWGGGLPHIHSLVFNAAGGLHTEALSYSQFLIALMDEKGLYPESFQVYFTPYVTLPDSNNLRTNHGYEMWGLGIGIIPTPSDTLYAHGGRNGDFTSSFMISKSRKYGYVFFINNERGDELKHIINKKLGLPH